MKLDTKWIITAIVVLIVVAGIGNLSTCGNKPPDDATTLNNLADLYRQQGKYEEAEPLFKQSLEIT
ncbi:MAG: tetratricopeptide repeat protein, partial [Candidatus Scalindua sp.]